MNQPGIYNLPQVIDRGVQLTVFEDLDFPFEVKRVFWLTDIQEKVKRGEHAHRSSKQLLIALKGTIKVQLEDVTGNVSDFILSQPDQALYIPPMYWGRIHFDQDSIGLSLAEDHYDESDYIREYADFKAMRK